MEHERRLRTAEQAASDRREEIRRAVDIDNLITRQEFEKLLLVVSENAKVIKDIHDLLLGLKVMAHIAKWVTVVAGCVGATSLAVKQMMGMKW